MSTKKKSNRLDGEEDEPSESQDSQMERQMDAFDSNEPWSELDELQNHLFNGSHEVSSPEDMPKKPKKRDKRVEREQQIIEYEQALKISQQKNKEFVDPFKPYKLNVSQEQYKKLLHGVVEEANNPQGPARILGIKSLRILHQERLYEQFKLIQAFLQTNKVPEWIKQSHEFLINSTGNTLFRTVENGGTMSVDELQQD